MLRASGVFLVPLYPFVRTNPHGYFPASLTENCGGAGACCAACCGGRLLPAIKTGYEWFGIAQDVPTKLVFAGWRFLWQALALLALALVTRRQVGELGRAARQLVVLGLAQTTLQYMFFYVGWPTPRGSAPS